MEGVLFDYEAFWDLNFQVDWRVSWLRLLDSVRPVSTFKPSLVVAVDAFPEEEPSSLWTALAARVRAQKVDWPSASGEGDTAEDLDEDGGASPSVSDEEVVDDISDGEEVELALDSDASQDLRLVVSHSRPTPSPRMGWSNFQFVGVSCRKCVREHLRICSSSIMPRPSPVWGGGPRPQRKPANALQIDISPAARARLHTEAALNTQEHVGRSCPRKAGVVALSSHRRSVSTMSALVRI